MTTAQSQTEPMPQSLSAGHASQDSSWYAIHTMARHEKRVSQQLQENRIVSFLPLVQQIRQWSDRRCNVEIPMFSCYTFVRIAQTTHDRLNVLRLPGVL